MISVVQKTVNDENIITKFNGPVKPLNISKIQFAKIHNTTDNIKFAESFLETETNKVWVRCVTDKGLFWVQLNRSPALPDGVVPQDTDAFKTLLDNTRGYDVLLYHHPKKKCNKIIISTVITCKNLDKREPNSVEHKKQYIESGAYINLSDMTIH